MKYSLILFLFFSSLNQKIENKLLSIDKIHQTGRKIKTLKLIYNAISCSCAQWSESKFNNKPEKRIYYYVERANSKLIDADKLWNGNNTPLEIEVTGEIINEIGVPKKYESEKVKLEPGKIFRYTNIKVVKNGV